MSFSADYFERKEDPGVAEHDSRYMGKLITWHRLIQGFPKTFHSFFERSSSWTWFFLSLDETEEDFENSRVFPAVESQKPEKSTLIAEQHLYVVKSEYYPVFLMGTRVRSKTSLGDEISFVQRQGCAPATFKRIFSPHSKTYKQITHAIKDNTEDNYWFDGCFPQTIFNGMIVAFKPIWKPL